MSPVVNYFTGEKAESYIFLVLGIVGIVIGCYLFWVRCSSFWKGFAIPLILVALLEIIVGTTLIYRSPKDIKRVESYVKNEQSKILTDEIPRMEKVMRNFVMFRYTEIALMMMGILIYLAFAKFDFWKGLGLGLFIQASIVLALDYFAESRGSIYLDYLNSVSHE